VVRSRASLATVTSRGPWRAAACMRRRTLGYGRQRCRAEGPGPRDVEPRGRAGNRAGKPGRRGGSCRRWKAPWSGELRGLLTRSRGEACLAARSADRRSFPRKGPRRRRVATEGVRGLVTSSVRGRKRRDREASRGGAVDRGSARTAWCPFDAHVRGSGSARSQEWSWAMAEAGGSPSSDAPPVDPPEVQRPKADRCRWPKGRPARGGRSRKGSPAGYARESDGPCWVHVVVSRLQKSERGIFLMQALRVSARKRAGDSLKRPARPLTRPAQDRGRRQGAGRAANVNNERDEPARAARLGSIRWKASWFTGSPSS